MRNSKVTSMLVVLMFLLVTGIQAQTVTPSKKYITKELNMWKLVFIIVY